MTQEERWRAMYEIMAFMGENHRRPLEYYGEERKVERRGVFERLMEA